jgi:alkylhydroperoxidase family enzyme
MSRTDLDPSTLEVARLRNAHRMHCRLCMSLRRKSAFPGGLDEQLVSQIAGTDLDGLSGPARTVAEVVDAFVGSPGAVPEQVVEAARANLAPEEIALLLLSLVVWTGNRVLVCLGLDEPVEPGELTMFDYSAEGVQSYDAPTCEGTEHA